MAMDVRKVKKLIELLEQSSVSEIEVREGEECVRISKHPPVSVAPVPSPSPQLVVSDAAAASAATSASASDAADGDSGHVVKSPMIGIFYAGSSPESDPYAVQGSTVNKGDALCIIEAMKVMNHVESPVTGIVKAVHVNNGEPVEYGEPLFTIE